jgi:hypothetical protein
MMNLSKLLELNSIGQRRKAVSLLLAALTVLGLSLSGMHNVHAATSDPSIGPSRPLFFNPNCLPSLPGTCNHPVWTTKNSRPALELTNTTGQVGTGLSGVAWHALGYAGTTADVSLDGTYTVTNGFLADGFTTILFAQNGTGALRYMNNSIPGVSSPASTGLPICGVVSSTGIQGGVVVPDSTKQYIALMWDPFYGSSPQFNLWVISATVAGACGVVTANPGGIGCSIGIPAAGDTIRYDVNYTSTGNTLGARVADLTSGTHCSFKRGLTTDGFIAPSPDIYWVLIEGNRGAFAADWSLYSVTITPTVIFGCNEDDGNGEFQGQNGQNGNFNLDNDQCEDGDQNQVSSTNVGDGKDFKSTQIISTKFDTVTHTVTITGLGTHGGAPVAFTFVAMETGPTTPGWVSFAFSDGYTNAGTLVSGSILLH